MDTVHCPGNKRLLKLQHPSTQGRVRRLKESYPYEPNNNFVSTNQRLSSGSGGERGGGGRRKGEEVMRRTKLHVAVSQEALKGHLYVTSAIIKFIFCAPESCT